MPAEALRQRISGKVRVQFRVERGRVVDAQILSGPEVYHASVREAVMKYMCRVDVDPFIAVQEFDFKVP